MVSDPGDDAPALEPSHLLGIDTDHVGILVASTVAALVGATILRISRSADEPVPGA